MKEYKHYSIEEIENLYPFELEAIIAAIKQDDEKRKQKL